MLKAVLFDLDQTLLDWSAAEPWEDYQFRRIQRVFEFASRHIYPLAAGSLDVLFSAFVAELTGAWQRGLRTLEPPDIRAVMAAALRAAGVPDDRLDMAAVMDAYDWQPAPGERAYPDALEVLPRLRAHGLELGIITNASHPMSYRDRELAAVGLLDLFPRCRLSAVDVGCLKPHRRIFERALEILAVDPAEAVFVGDSLEADIRGAQGVGMRGVWRAEGQDLLADEGDILPDGTIATLHDLLPLLDGWYPGWRNGHAR